MCVPQFWNTVCANYRLLAPSVVFAWTGIQCVCPILRIQNVCATIWENSVCVWNSRVVSDTWLHLLVTWSSKQPGYNTTDVYTSLGLRSAGDNIHPIVRGQEVIAVAERRWKRQVYWLVVAISWPFLKLWVHLFKGRGKTGENTVYRTTHLSLIMIEWNMKIIVMHIHKMYIY